MRPISVARNVAWEGDMSAGRGSVVEKVAPFLALDNLKPFITKELESSTYPVLFKPVKGSRAWGYKAELLPQVCEIYLKARDAGTLLESQKKFAKACDLLMRGLAHIGIIALVDEATGYQYDRARDELNKILQAYISKELLPWTKRFPDEFFMNIYRIRGWEFKPGNHKRPRLIGKLINKLIYEPLPPGVLNELRKRNPPTEKGYRKYRHHQFLTRETGHPHLDKQIVEVITLMRVSDDRIVFERLFQKAFPKTGQQLALEYTESEEKSN
ncbi:hypothetical protein EPN95_04685 [Patescibacteria group bacterium]|nr:MAG: hypothetical protein EPN95_04685 [Patescibacteria group bacterium]